MTEGGSEAALVIALDRERPWLDVVHVITSAAQPHVAAHRVFLAVRHAGTGMAGCMAVYLPVDGAGDAQATTFDARLGCVLEDAQREATVAAVAARAASAPGLQVLLTARADTPFHAVVSLLDAFAPGECFHRAPGCDNSTGAGPWPSSPSPA